MYLIIARLISAVLAWRGQLSSCDATVEGEVGVAWSISSLATWAMVAFGSVGRNVVPRCVPCFTTVSVS